MYLDRLAEGAVVSGLGILVVLVFLSLLVLMTTALGRLAQRIEARRPPSAEPATADPAARPELVAAIGAAVAMHRRRHASSEEVQAP